MLRTRIITAAVLLAVLAGAICAGDRYFNVVMAIAFGIVLAEWLQMTDIKAFGYPAGIVLAAAAVCIAWNKIPLPAELIFVWFLVVSCVWLALTAVCFAARDRGFALKDTTSILLAFLCIPASWLSIYLFMHLGSWPLTLSIFMIVWLADACAYFAGRLFGKNRMAPAISPKKTWEGAAGAVVSVFFTALLVWFTLPHGQIFTSILFERVGFFVGFLTLFLLVVVSIAGDLFESSLKRHAGIKDSGKLLPGHGGFFDRLDAALAVLPCCALLCLML